MQRSLLCLVCCAVWPWASSRLLAAETDAIRVPDGFEIVEFARDELAHDAFSLTHDAQGRPVVSGPGYVRRLEDHDRDGRADRFSTLFEGPRSGAQGLCFVGDDLYFTGDRGLWRLSGADPDGRYQGPPTRLAELANPEHGAHQIVQGPDGWLYVVCGNDAGVSAAHVRSETSPIRAPHSGAILRFSLDGRRAEIVADGFRNPYDLAFTADGRLFTIDSDGERDQYLPWYAPTRVFDVASGARHGWVSGGWTRSWSHPAEWFDSAPRFAELGRGSPTGAIIYRHRAFPERHRRGLFTACWTLGRVYFVPLKDADAAKPEVFLETQGDSGLAPVDLEVGPEGDLWLAIGGRGTRGGVFRVRSVQAAPPPQVDELSAVLGAPQPLAAWSRQQWMPLARKLGASEFLDFAGDERKSVAERVRAVEILTECWEGLDESAARSIVSAAPPEVVARSAWSLGRTSPAGWKATLAAQLTSHPSPLVQRAAWEALGQMPASLTADAQPSWETGCLSADRGVRQAMTAAALGALGDHFPRSIAEAPLPIRLRAAEIDALAGRAPSPQETLAIARDVFEQFQDPDPRLEAVRLLQLAHGDVWTGAESSEEADAAGATNPTRVAGYSAARRVPAPTDLGDWLLSVFPSGDAALDRELARLAGLAGLGQSQLVDKLVAPCTPQSSPDDDLHYLFALAELPAPWSDESRSRVASALAALHGKMTERGWRASRNWPEHVAQLVERLAQRDARLPAELARQQELRWPAQAACFPLLTADDRALAARRMLSVIAKAEEPAPYEALRWLAELPSKEVAPALRAQAEAFGPTAEVLRQLSTDSSAEDRELFVLGLGALDPYAASAAARALAKRAGPVSDEDVAGAIAALRRWSLPSDGQDAEATSADQKARESLSALLAKWTGQREIDATCAEAEYAPVACATWLAWFDGSPAGRALAARRSNSDWTNRLATIRWDAGDVDRGRQVFAQRSCARCHEGGARLGPDLRGVAQRLTRADLLTAIVEPAREVSPAYRLRHYEMKDGRAYAGQVIYESPEATLVQIDAERSVRLSADDIARETTSERSLMPEALLDRLDDAAVADLFAYLASLRPQR